MRYTEKKGRKNKSERLPCIHTKSDRESQSQLFHTHLHIWWVRVWRVESFWIIDKIQPPQINSSISFSSSDWHILDAFIRFPLTNRRYMWYKQYCDKHITLQKKKRKKKKNPSKENESMSHACFRSEIHFVPLLHTFLIKLIPCTFTPFLLHGSNFSWVYWHS